MRPDGRQLLVVDSDTAFLENLVEHSRNLPFPIRAVQTGREAQLLIADRENQFAGVFVSSALERSPNWLSVIRCSLLSRPATPLYFISASDSLDEQLSSEERRKLGIRETLHKPLGYRDLLELVAPIALTFDSAKALQEARRLSETSGVDVLTHPEGFLAIRAEDFLSGSKSFFDVYIQLNSGRFLMLLRAGDVFTPERVESYLSKGVTEFYIRKEVQELYLQYCDHLASRLVRSDAAPMDLKVTQTLNHGEEVSKYLRNTGLRDGELRYANKFVENVRQLALQIDAKANPEVAKFLDNIALYDHGVGTAMIAGLLANTMSIAAEQPFQIVGCAALLHDLALSSLPAHLWDEDESRMTPAERETFRRHPANGAEALRKIRGIHPAAIQAIEQHHLRLGGAGFPRRTGTTIVSRVSEIIGISDEFCNRIAIAAKTPGTDPLKEMQLHVFHHFGAQVVKAFKATFEPKLISE